MNSPAFAATNSKPCTAHTSRIMRRRAERLAQRALSLAAREGMGLRATAAFVLLARVAAKTQSSKIARRMLESAIRRARAQEYFLQAAIAREAMDELDSHARDVGPVDAEWRGYEPAS